MSAENAADSRVDEPESAKNSAEFKKSGLKEKGLESGSVKIKLGRPRQRSGEREALSKTLPNVYVSLTVLGVRASV